MQDIKEIEENTPQKIMLTKNNIAIDSDNIYTNSTESKNASMNLSPSAIGNNGIIKLDQENSKIKKKKRVSFIDQIQSKKEIAQIIYINDRASLNDDKINYNKYIEQFRKQNTNITESNKAQKQKTEEVYKIKRPKKSLFSKRKVDKIDEHCTCDIF